MKNFLQNCKEKQAKNVFAKVSLVIIKKFVFCKTIKNCRNTTSWYG
jgi:hypothetical protein